MEKQKLKTQQSHQANWKKSVSETYDQYHSKREWTEDLIKACEEADIEFMTTPYDIEAIEIFEYDFSVKAVLGSSTGIVDLNDYFDAEDYAELGEVEAVVGPVNTLLQTNLASMQENGFWGELNRDLGVSYVAIALSDFAKIEDAKLVVVGNKRESVSRQIAADNYAFGVFAAVFLLVLREPQRPRQLPHLPVANALKFLEVEKVVKTRGKMKVSGRSILTIKLQWFDQF